MVLPLQRYHTELPCNLVRYLCQHRPPFQMDAGSAVNARLLHCGVQLLRGLLYSSTLSFFSQGYEGVRSPDLRD